MRSSIAAARRPGLNYEPTSKDKELRMRITNPLAALALGLAVVSLTLAGDPREKNDAKPEADKPSTPADLQQQKIAAAEQAMKLSREMLRNGNGNPEDTMNWAKRWHQSRLEAAATHDERLTILKSYVAVAEENQAVEQRRMESGLSSQLNVLSARYFRIEAEQELQKEEGRKP